MKKTVVALAGNPNSGKTTLFNRLTGTRQTTGNWPGVTVEKKIGYVKEPYEMTLIDLPGLYSIASSAAEETIAREFILNDAPDVVINLIDATNLERNLYLTLQLRKLGRPLVIALNMMDELLSHGDTLRVERLEEHLGAPVVPITARTGEGVDRLLDVVMETAGKKTVNECNTDACIETPEETKRLYEIATQIHAEVLTHSHDRSALSTSDRIDAVLTHRIFAYPIFLIIMALIFFITFSEYLGGFLSDKLAAMFDGLGDWTGSSLSSAGVPIWLESLVTDGIISGVGGILSFLPQIAILSFFLTILEDSGYMARTAFLTDRIFRSLGLTGHSFIPMILGFGCTVPAIISARSIERMRDRRLTVLITPFMSCSARMPIYALLTRLFFPHSAGIITFGLYLFGIFIAFMSAFILNKVIPGKEEADFIIELPPYRIPYARTLFLHVWDKVKDFIFRAATIIFLMSIVIWLLQSFSPQFQYVTDNEQSILYTISCSIYGAFIPLGFPGWQAVSALFAGLIAKESLVSSLSILLPGTMIATFFSPLSALSFLVFCLLYTPCAAAVGATVREMQSRAWTIGAILWQTGIAYLFSLLTYQIGSLFI